MDNLNGTVSNTTTSVLGNIAKRATPTADLTAEGRKKDPCMEGISIGLLILGAGAIGVMFFALFTKITMAGRRRRRRRRHTMADPSGPAWFEREESGNQDGEVDILASQWGRDVTAAFASLLTAMAGMQDFEEKVQRWAAGEPTSAWLPSDSPFSEIVDASLRDSLAAAQNVDFDPVDWVARTVNVTSFHPIVDAEGLEPPVYDEMWPLMHRPASQDDWDVGQAGNGGPAANSTDVIALPSLDVYSWQARRGVACQTVLWNCVVDAVAAAARFRLLRHEGRLRQYLERVVYRVAFYGPFGTVWRALMSIPEARRVRRCFNVRADCEWEKAMRQSGGRAMLLTSMADDVDDTDDDNNEDFS